MINVAGIELEAPVILAAGTAGIINEMADVLDLSPAGGVGAVVTKSITPQPREGNQTWRILPAGPSAMINAIGLANPGLDAFLEHSLGKAKGMRTKVFVSVAGFSVEDYRTVASNVDAWVGDRGGPAAANVHAIELNVSCPNVRTGTEFGGSPELIVELLEAVRPHVRRCKLFVKLSPMVGTSELISIARSAVSAGADGLTLCNTVPAMLIDVRSRRPRLANITGGLSGPAVHPIVTRHIYDVYRRVTGQMGRPILGLGGVCNWEDAAEFVLAGASAVQVGTMLFADAGAPKRIARGLAKWQQAQGASSLADLVGKVDLSPLPGE